MQNLNVVTTIQEIYEKEIKSSNITNPNSKISIEDGVIIEREYEEDVKRRYENGEIRLEKYDFKKVNFNTRIDIQNNIEEAKDKVDIKEKDLEGFKPEVKEHTVNVMVTKTEYYGGAVTIQYLTEEEKETKIAEVEELFMDRYCYSDCDLDDELQYLDRCEVDVELADDDYYDDVAENICDDYDEKFGYLSLDERRDILGVYIISKKENYLRKVISRPEMIPYAEYIIETKNTIIMLYSERDYKLLKKNFDNILSIEETSKEDFFKITLNNFY